MIQDFLWVEREFGHVDRCRIDLGGLRSDVVDTSESWAFGGVGTIGILPHPEFVARSLAVEHALNVELLDHFSVRFTWIGVEVIELTGIDSAQ